MDIQVNLNDLAFELIIPGKASLGNLNFQHKTKEWEGVNYDQGLSEAYFGTNFHLIKTPLEHRLSRIPKRYKSKQWSCISIRGQGLKIFAMSLSGIATEEKGFSLENLITTLAKFKGPWAVVFEPDCDFELDTYNNGTIDNVMERIKFSLTVKKTGFIIWGES